MRTQTQTQDVMEEGQNLARTTQSGRAWVFTLNNYSEEEAASAMDWAEDECAYVVFGWELAPTTYIPHVQGYFRLRTPMRYFESSLILTVRNTVRPSQILTRISWC